AAVAFPAAPSLAAADGPGLEAEAHVNSALVASATDEAGNSGVGGEPYDTAPDTATATLQVPALTIAKTPDGGAAVAGEDAAFSIVVGNSGDSPAREVAIRDVLPAGLSYTAGGASATYSGGALGFAEQSVAVDP